MNRKLEELLALRNYTGEIAAYSQSSLIRVTVARVVVDYFDSNLYWQILVKLLSVRPLMI